MSDLFRFQGALPRDPGVDAWFDASGDAMRAFVQPWFERMRDCGPDVRELLHDGRPTACVGEAAFGYVDAFSSHVTVGFFQGAALDDPGGLLQGGGKRMRHVKLHWGRPVNPIALSDLIVAAYQNMRSRLVAEGA